MHCYLLLYVAKVGSPTCTDCRSISDQLKLNGTGVGVHSLPDRWKRSPTDRMPRRREVHDAAVRPCRPPCRGWRHGVAVRWCCPVEQPPAVPPHLPFLLSLTKGFRRRTAELLPTIAVATQPSHGRAQLTLGRARACTLSLREGAGTERWPAADPSTPRAHGRRRCRRLVACKPSFRLLPQLSSSH